MNILFYYPDKERTISLSSLMLAFQKQGHCVSLLTHATEGDLHEYVKRYGIETYTYPIKKNISFAFYIRHIIHLVWFTNKHKIDIVYSHIQLANIISVFAQFFSRTRFILCRHHSDCAYIDNNWREKLFDKIINRLGKEFIVPSKKVFNQMTTVEKVPANKIHLIRYAYNFEEYPKADMQSVNEIRQKYHCRLLLVKIARLIPEKRHIVLFNVMRQMVSNNMDVKLLVLSEGPERENLENYIYENSLEDNIFMLGYKNDSMNYIASADLIVHVSASEASNSMIKEAALAEKPVIVCGDVGDFDEYVINNKNGIVLSKENTENELYDALEAIYSGRMEIRSLGSNLKETVVRLFSMDAIICEYEQFHI